MWTHLRSHSLKDQWLSGALTCVTSLVRFLTGQLPLLIIVKEKNCIDCYLYLCLINRNGYCGSELALFIYGMQE